jgi:5-oxoprolinase (ATP-hydrolysing)
MPVNEFWIDVGGTFTDCIGRDASGTLHTHKLLSSGAYKGRVRPGGTPREIPIDAPVGTPREFFRGFLFRLGGEECLVAAYDAARSVLRLATPLAAAPTAGERFELTSPEPAPVAGMRFLARRPYPEPLGDVSLKLGTTRGTNALLERKGARVAVVLTRGFGDLLAIGYQNRPALFALDIRKARPLHERVVEADERLLAKGDVERPLDRASLREQLAACRRDGIATLAVCLLHAHVNDAHERLVEDEARALGFSEIVLSSRVAPLERVVARAETTVLDAYLTPVTAAWLASVQAAIPDADFKVMTSSGGLVDARLARGKDLILSGPAGGAVGVAEMARATGERAVLGFDMGGTSTDVCRYDGRLDRRYELELTDPETGAALRVLAPMLAVDTVAAGGGSICSYDGIRLLVGPDSAGADPGPACYGRGGPLTVTDCNVVLGRVRAERFAFPLDAAAARTRLAEVAAAIRRAGGRETGIEELAEGFLAVAVSTMAGAVKRLAMARGHDVRAHTLQSFGGAGAQHACQIASELGIERVLQPLHASLLSAYGIGVADVAKHKAHDSSGVFDEAAQGRADAVFAAMEAELDRELAEGRLPQNARLSSRRSVDLRYAGQDHFITVDVEPGRGPTQAFEEAHRRLFGFAFPERTIEARALRLERVAVLPRIEETPEPEVPHAAAGGVEVDVYMEGAWRKAPCFELAALRPGARLEGPALVTGAATTLVVEHGWQAYRTGLGHVTLTRASARTKAQQAASGAAADPVQLALFANRFTQIAEQMGTMLQRTALSVNVKERQDFSCALFDATGALVVNAPHIPVHLGSMGDTVRALIAEKGAELAPGDVYVTNDPYRGGSHLPDVTVITPVFDETGSRLLFFTGSRAHHAEIGGVTPGSMPPFSRTLAEEGVLIPWHKLVERGVSREDALRAHLAGAPYPSRSPDDNVADLRAQAAAGETGRRLLEALIEAEGLDNVLAYMRHIRASAERKTRLVLGALPPGRRSFADALDDGTPIAVTVTIPHAADGGPAATIDFSGTGPVSAGNLNANAAIVKAATLYALRCLIAEELPLNEGVLAAVHLVVPTPSLLAPPAGDAPAQLAAVVGGNVETSQRLVDVLLAAFGLAAASQGTMNNFLFGRPPSQDRPGFGYYETICGGAGAGPGFPGADAVHTHMTNTRITDPEVLERRYPVILRRFAIRRGSGGAGRQPGGDGVVREVELREPLLVSLLTTRRALAPFGLDGGSPGKAGRNVHIKKDGSEILLTGRAQLEAEAGERLRIETPGGGGYGPPAAGSPTRA